MKYIRYKEGSGYEKHISLTLAYLNVQLAILSIALSISIGPYAITAISIAAILTIALARKRIPGRTRTYLMLLPPNLLSAVALLSIMR